MTIDQLAKAYTKIREALKGLDKLRNDQAKVLEADATLVEKALIEKLQTDQNMSELVRYYNEGRDELDDLDNQFKTRKAHLALRQEKLEDSIFELLRASNAESMRTINGTAFTTTQVSVKIADWQVFLDHVKQTNEWELLKRAASKDAVKAYLERTETPVPGVDYSTRLQVSVRRK